MCFPVPRMLCRYSLFYCTGLLCLPVRRIPCPCSPRGHLTGIFLREHAGAVGSIGPHEAAHCSSQNPKVGGVRARALRLRVVEDVKDLGGDSRGSPDELGVRHRFFDVLLSDRASLRQALRR